MEFMKIIILNVLFLSSNQSLKSKFKCSNRKDLKKMGKRTWFCRLTKSLYDLKQAPRCWYKRFDSFIFSLGYNRLSSNHCIYYKRFDGDDFIILLLYVDDMLVASPNKDCV